MKIWRRYFLMQNLKMFLFFLGCLYFLYVIVDLSANGVRFLSKIALGHITLYYAYTFSTLFDLFVSLAFLLSTLQVLSLLNRSGEFVALQMAGLSKKALLAPFFWVAATLSLLSYVNCQWIAPKAKPLVATFKILHKPSRQKRVSKQVQSLILNDGSTLVYRKSDPLHNQLIDVFWIKNPRDIWHIEKLTHDAAYGEKHFVRNEDKQFTLIASDKIEPIHWTQAQKPVPLEERSPASLAMQAWIGSMEQPRLLTHLYHKLLLPLLPFLILIALAPITLRFSRLHRFFLISAGALFAFVAIKILLDGMVILGENRVLPPLLAIASPFLLTLALFLPRFAKMR